MCSSTRSSSSPARGFRDEDDQEIGFELDTSLSTVVRHMASIVFFMKARQYELVLSGCKKRSTVQMSLDNSTSD